MCEREIEQYLIEQVRAYEGEIRKLKWIGRRGAPDRFVMMGWGRCAFVELKAPGEVPEDHQEREITRLRSRGMRVYVIDSEEGVDEMVREML